MTLRGKIILLGLIAMLGLAVTLGQNLFLLMDDHQRQAGFESFVERVAAEVAVVHQLQRERGLTAAYLANPEAAAARRLDEQRLLTDEAYAAAGQGVGRADVDALLAYRGQVYWAEGDESRWFYTRLIRNRLLALGDQAAAFSGERHGAALAAHGHLLFAKEYLGQMRAILSGALSGDGLDWRGSMELAGIFRLFQESSAKFQRYADAGHGERFRREIEDNRDFLTAMRVVQDMVTGRRAADGGKVMAGAAWYGLATRVIDVVHGFERDYFTHASALVAAEAATARQRAIAMAALLLLCGAAVLLLAIHTIRRLLVAVDRLLDGVGNIVEKQDFGLRLAEHPPLEVARISRGFNELLDIVDALLAEKDYLATTDPLTGVANRAKFAALAAPELERCHRHGGGLALLVFDVDHFKRINDLHGHGAGDRVLREIAALMAGQLRCHDTLARWGGDEFVVLVPESGSEGAVALAQKLRLAVANYATEGIGPVRCSFGVAEYQPGDTLEALFARADGALYAAKAQGRNRVGVAGTTGITGTTVAEAVA